MTCSSTTSSIDLTAMTSSIYCRYSRYSWDS